MNRLPLHHHRPRIRHRLTPAATALLSLALVAAGASPAAAAGEPTPVQLELGAVKNIDIGRAGRLVFADFGGPSVKVQEYTASGRGRLHTLAELPAASGFAVAAQSDRGDTWVAYGVGDPSAGGEMNSLWKVHRSGQATKVLDLAVYQAGDPDPYDIEDNPAETNAYDIEVMRDGSALVADAAGNDLLRVTEDGDVTTVACFPTEVVSTEDVPFEIPDLPMAIPAEAVPTGVSVGRDGYAYVSELKGFPFKTGSSKVWRVDPDGQGLGCDGTTNSPVAPGEVVASGFSGINDVTVDRRGNLYVTELHRDGVWAAEGGFQDPSSLQGTGRLTKVTDGERTEIAAGHLTFPGSAAVSRRGEIFVVDSFLEGANVVRIA